MRTCTICKTECDDARACQKCLADFSNRRDAMTMSVDERIAELGLRFGIVEIPFVMTMRRICELVGRPVWSHELTNLEALVEEIRKGDAPTDTDIIEKISTEKRIFIVV